LQFATVQQGYSSLLKNRENFTACYSELTLTGLRLQFAILKNLGGLYSLLLSNLIRLRLQFAAPLRLQLGVRAPIKSSFELNVTLNLHSTIVKV